MAKKGSSAARKPSATTNSKRPKTLGPKIEDLRHDAKRLNTPRGGDADYDFLPRKKKTYAHDPHLPPVLEWAGKAERPSASVDTVSLHIHQYVSALDILRAVQREDVQGSLWPELSPSKQIDFYAHEVGWANRMILGDSLVVMNSLLEREQLAGKVQCIYIDPPYGVKFNSNFQPFISKREVKDGDDASLTREPEQIQAYRDTWELGVHSYLTYLRDRLVLARSLLNESGSLFVQISDENMHHVRELLDEVFGVENFVSMISFKTTGGHTDRLLSSDGDYILWYARDRERAKFRQIYRGREAGDEGAERYVRAVSPDGRQTRRLTKDELDGTTPIPKGWRRYRLTSLTSQGFRENTSVPWTWDGETFDPGKNLNWKTTLDGLERLAKAGRIEREGRMPAYRRFLDDFPVVKLTATWTDTQTNYGGDKLYVVRTPEKVVARCVLMTTDPGDLVLDPTCGSGTAAYVAEQWGRRWITCDTSRVALAIARQRLLGSRFPYYRLRSDKVRDGFQYTTVPHVTLKSIAQNPRLDACKTREERESLVYRSAEQETLYDRPVEDPARVRVSGPFTVEAIPVAVAENTNTEDAPPSSSKTRAGSAPADFVSMMLDLVRKTGVRFPNKRHLSIPTLRPLKAPYEYLHAEGESEMEGDPRRIAVSFGSQHAPVTPFQVRDAIEKARGYDIVLFIGFGCDPEARRMMEAVRGREVQFVHAAPDILVNDLLKTKKTSNLFTAFGSPDVRVRKQRDGQVTVELSGVDLYDPITGNTTHGRGDDVAAWFVDQDYDGRTFCICQALFPARSIKDPWEKLQKALKGRINADVFETLRGTESLPFKPGKKVAVSVIDDRGNEVMKLVELVGA